MGSEWRDAVPPASLFPSATSIRLSGQTTREIAAGILAESSKRLENLGLNNLIQFSEMEPPLPTFTIADDFHEYWEVHGGRGHKTIPGTRLMAGIIDTLLERCPSSPPYVSLLEARANTTFASIPGTIADALRGQASSPR
jgi:hypothetical protein